MRSALATVANRRAARQRSTSLSAIPPAESSGDYLPELAAVAASIVYKSPLESPDGHPVFILNAAAFPDTYDVDYDSLLPYVLARLPGEDDLITGTEYEVVFLAGGQADGATSEKRQDPGIGWYLQAYHVLSRAMRKRLQKLYIVHPRTWVRVLVTVFSTVVSPKFRRKIMHISNLSALGQKLPLEDLLLPPSTYLHDRRLEAMIESATGTRAFGARPAFPPAVDGERSRLPRVLRETTTFILHKANIITEGLFRIPPHSILAGVLREQYERGQKFIIWKEHDVVLAQPDTDSHLLKEIRTEDSYGIHLAAALIKTWYRELEQPVFPQTTYSYVQDQFGAAGAEVSIEDLIRLLDVRSSSSCLSLMAREILSRHLLPLLHAVAQHQNVNKMTPQNLAIIFAITLVRSSDELEDVKISGLIQLILKAAITRWLDLREALDVDEGSFRADLQPPSNSEHYEDPASDYKERLQAGNVDVDDHRTVMLDESSPTVAARKAENSHVLRRIPVPAARKEAIAPPVPRRKPAPISKQPDLRDPPRSSSIADVARAGQVRSISGTVGNAADSTTSSVLNETSPVINVILPESFTKVPLRKEVEHKGPKISQDAAQFIMDSQATVTLPTDDTASTNGSRPESENTNESTTFRKPSWPASANRLPEKLPALAKPVLPGIQALTIPHGTSIAAFPKPRTPSAGLLERMNSIEAYSANNEKANSPNDERAYRLTPSRLNLRKTSVDDLRRLYEDRVSTMQGLAKVDGIKRSQSQS